MSDHDDLGELSGDFRVLSDEVKAASLKLDAHHDAYLEDKEAQRLRTEAAKEKARKATYAGIISFFVGVIGITVAIFALSTAADADQAAEKAQAALDAFLADRAANQVTACDQQADTSQKINTLNDRTQDLLRAVAEGSTNPETAGFIAAQLAEFEAVKVPVRACDPASIAVYYASGGTEGYLP